MPRLYNRIRPFLETTLVIALFLVFVRSLEHWWKYYSLNLDEGFNLAKAALLTDGYGLYTEIWSDQPPVFTYLLSVVHVVSGGSVAAGRVLVLLFAAVIVGSLFTLVRRHEGRLAAWVAVAVLASSPMFLVLSVSIMIGLPAIAFGILAMDQVSRASLDHRKWRIWVAGLIFALSLQTKMFTLLTLPALLFLSYQSAPVFERPREGVIRSLQLLLAIIAVFSVIAFIVKTDFEQLISSHAATRRLSDQWISISHFSSKKRGVGDIVLILGIIGLLVSLMFRVRDSLPPLLWFVVAFFGLIIHRPVWWHHLLLLIVPLSWLAGCGARRLFEKTRGRQISGWRRDVTVVGLALATLLLHDSHTDDYRSAIKFLSNKRDYKQAENMEAHDRLLWFAGNNQWVFTDHPIDVYRAGLRTLPSISVITGKRLKAGNLTINDMKQDFETYRPVQVSIRFSKFPELIPYLERRFLTTRKIGKYKHFIDPTALKDSLNGLLVARGKKPFSKSTDAKMLARLMIETFELVRISKTMGYGGVYDNDRGVRYERNADDAPLRRGQVVARPPHSTQQIGSCFLASFRATGLDRFLHEATAAARALACSQTRGGGLRAVGIRTKSCHEGSGEIHRTGSDRNATFDDGTIATAIDFAFALEDELANPPPWLTSMIEAGLAFILANQAPSGGWPQRVGNASEHHGSTTLDDSSTTGIVDVLLKAHRRTGAARYLEAAKRGEEFLLSVRGSAGQADRAQPYAADGMPEPSEASGIRSTRTLVNRCMALSEAIAGVDKIVHETRAPYP